MNHLAVIQRQKEEQRIIKGERNSFKAGQEFYFQGFSLDDVPLKYQGEFEYAFRQGWMDLRKQTQAMA